MDHIKNLLCILSLSDTDKYTIKYTAHIARIVGADKIYVNFINEHLNLPEYAKNLYPGNTPQENQVIIDKMREDILTVHISDIEANVQFDVFDKGSIHDSCLKLIVEKHIDLVIYRKNSSYPDSTNFATKLTRRSTCSVLILTENLSHFSKILVPVDFSPHSKEALESAISLSKYANIQEINLLHVIKHPNISNWKSDHDHEEFLEILKNQAAKEGENFLKELQATDIKINPIFKVDENIQNRIQKVIKELKIDLVIVGARGNGSGISIFLGSVSESLIKDLNIPTLTVKSKGTGLNILKMLFSS